MKKDEYPLLRKFFYHAIYVTDGCKMPDQSILKHPDLAKYFENFGADGEHALVAENAGIILGVIWGRNFDSKNKGYGYYADGYIELSMAVLLEYRKQGIGKELLSSFIKLEKSYNTKGLSLSVSKDNFAQHLYKEYGFQIVEERDSDLLMKLDL